MINQYSYKISRNEADVKKLKDELVKNKLKIDIKEFSNIWVNIKEYATQYKGNQMEKQDSIDETMHLSHFLVDDGEKGKGMYLASGYEQFIKWQNNFIKPIIKTLDNNKDSILYYFNENLKHKIDVQKATDKEIIKKNFPEFPDSCNYINFLHLINLNSQRNIFLPNGEINYSNYNNFVCDFETIEEELGHIILTGKNFLMILFIL